MVEYPESNLCPNCGGDGLGEGEFCLPCNGTGYVSTHGESLYRKAVQERIETIENKCDDIMDKCNDIFEKVNE